MGDFVESNICSGVNNPDPILKKFASSLTNDSALPFHESISGDDTPLLYKHFYEWHLSFLKDHLTNLKELECMKQPEGLHSTNARHSHNFNDFMYKENRERPARVYNQCFQSDEFRKIRMTYYDAGPRCQVFNALWYPNYECDLPLLGIDLLAFNQRKATNTDSDDQIGRWNYLTIMDFQPILDDEDDIAIDNISVRNRDYEHEIMQPIRSKYPSLHGSPSKKFYDDHRFFSSKMLYGRFENNDILNREVYPAFKEFTSAYSKLVQNEHIKEGKTVVDKKRIEDIKNSHINYDTYNAKSDPAKFMFAKVFGKEWAEDFVHGFLFSNSEIESENDQTYNSQEKNYGIGHQINSITTTEQTLQAAENLTCVTV